MKDRVGRPSACRLLLSLALVTASAASGCDLSQMAFTQDHRLHIQSPKSLALVSTPLRLSWTMTGFTVARAGSAPPSKDAGYYALFVDRAPVGPGQSLLTLADKNCRATPGCFNAQYLAEKGVYTTTSSSFTLEQVPALNSYQKVQVHEVTIVLMDTAGRRIGENEWYVDFRLRAASV